MKKTLSIGIIGCGDFLRLQKSDLMKSSRVKVKMLFDVDQNKAEAYAKEIGGKAVSTPDAIFADKEIDLVGLFVPPWVRKDLVLKAAQSGKHIITTKPLGSSVQECQEMVDAARGKIIAGVVYNRTANRKVSTLKKVFNNGSIGRLALYKQDWMHHYPQWNNWALDPKKNGGPFMDAMIHNLNVARYLIGTKATQGTFFSDNHAHPGLTCNDTELLKLDFENQASAHLFITWAGDLEVMDTTQNAREHIDIWNMVTDKGWLVNIVSENSEAKVLASRKGEKKYFSFEPSHANLYDRFASSIDSNGSLPEDMPSLQEAYEDIRIIRKSAQLAGKAVSFI